MLNQGQLTVTVKRIVLGEIETDAEDVLAFIDERVKDYAIEKYAGDAEEAKKDRAELNKGDTKMKDMIAELTAQWMAPIQPTIDKLTDGRKKIKTASLACDSLVKAKEAAEDEIKRNQITEYWNTRQFDLVPLERIFDSRWLNKGSSLQKEVYPAIDAKINDIYECIKTIEDVGGEDVVVMKSEYLKTLDLGFAVRRGKELKEDRARLASEAAARPEREFKGKIEKQQVELAHEEIEAQREVPIAALASQVLGLTPEPEDPVVTKCLKFTASRSKLFALQQYLTSNGILYEKIEAIA